ncbi:GDSL esterase/lipase At3g43570-like [Lolium rigidum]|uniref:GDSL esterase/lipase At3g43570-like n=1 Tax=Lolium rigidum TaxID=89674 RepID=UPI001F5CA3DD|nr:GDSL esterase/lipase At3g43570-like [Lolium rigidum]
MGMKMTVALIVLAMAAAVCGRDLNQTMEATAQGWRPRGRPLATALIVFGDSIVDPGNNNNLPATRMKANHAPYGKDFAGHVATGRFSNALLPPDLIAQRLNLKQLLPPWLNVDHTPEDLLTGVSFASGATGFDPLTPQLVNVFTMDQELEFFDTYRQKLVGLVGEQETRRIIDGAFFFVCTATDDVANTYFMTPYRAFDYDIPAYVDLLLVGAEAFLRNTSARGAKKMGFTGMPPIGCVPSQRTIGGGVQRRCDARRNYAALMYNKALQELIGRLNADPGFHTHVVYFNIYDIIYELAVHGERWGFTEMTRGCCGSGLIEVTQLCNTQYMGVCDDVDKHVFFDSYHPTQRAYEIIVDHIFKYYVPLMHL